jgi:multidrug efflux pump
VQVFGAKYAMRIWLDPAKLATYRLVPSDIVAAIHAQNAQVAAGQLGGTPAIDGSRSTPRSRPRIACRPRSSSAPSCCAVNPTAAVLRSAMWRVSNSVPRTTPWSALQRPACDRCRGDRLRRAPTRWRPRCVAALERCALLPGRTEDGAAVRHHAFVRVSIEEVVKTLLEAVVLVFLVMYLFLQNFRATLIPTIAVPVVLLGTFGVLLAFGFSINMLTMFAMVLAIGLLVDDAIVVVENVERVMSEEGLSPLEATRKSMDQITGALVGIGVVLAAVFVPMAFLRRLHRRDLPAVHHHHRVGDGAVGAGRDRADAGAVRDHAQTLEAR